MAYEVAAIRSWEELANLRRRRISLTRGVGCWSPVPILDAVLNTGDLQERRVVVRSSERRPPLGYVRYARKLEPAKGDSGVKR